jgi:ABC-type Na+ efflux pump permease subunit
MIRALLVALREVRAYLQDKADLAFSLLLPIAVFALMYGAFGGDTMFHSTAYVVNEDQGGSYSTLLLERLNENESLTVELLSSRDADDKLDRSDLLMVIFIPQGFSDKLASGEHAQLIFKQRGNGGEDGQIVASIVRGAAEEINQELQVYSQVNSALEDKQVPQETIETTVGKFLEREREYPIVGIKEETVGSSPDPVDQFLPKIITMFILFSVTLSARAIVEERRNGTLERLMTTRLSVGQLFTGKFLAGIFRGFVQTIILMVLAWMVFQLFTPLSFLASLLVIVVFAAAASALGLLIACLARSEDAATWIAVFFTMITVVLGGTFMKLPESTATSILVKLSINTYANDALDLIITKGGSLSDTGLELAVLAGVAVAGLIISRLIFRVMPGGK